MGDPAVEAERHQDPPQAARAKAGLTNVYAHRWRHSFAHERKMAGGDTGDLMLLLGWSSEEMARRYGASAAAERAQRTQTRLGIGERVWHEIARE
jgi:integrase/recombinase XerC